MNKIKPCPFCGNKEPAFLRGYEFKIGCRNCGVWMPSSYTEETAIKSWNLRIEDKEETLLKFKTIDGERFFAYDDVLNVLAGHTRKRLELEDRFAELQGRYDELDFRMKGLEK